jgi:PAS domain S-box-containing protein
MADGDDNSTLPGRAAAALEADRVRPRLVAALVAFLTVACIALWVWQHLRTQTLLRDQLLAQAEKRSLQLADAMAGQVAGLFTTVDLALLQLRGEWDGRAEPFDARVRLLLDKLPAGAVSHFTVVDVEGYTAYNSLHPNERVYVGDRPHILAHREGGDRLVVGTPVYSRLSRSWTLVATRPILREGRYAGAVNASVSTEYLSRKLAGLRLSEHDVVALIDGEGRFLARSTDHEKAMGQRLPADRPFLANPQVRNGLFRVPGQIDGIWRTYAWQRLEGSALVTAIGLSDDTVLAPLQESLRNDRKVGVVVLVLLLGFGGSVAAMSLALARQQARVAASQAFRERAQRNLELMQFAIDHSHDAVMSLDINGRVLRANDQACRSLGLTQEEILNQSIRDFDPSFTSERMAELRSRLRREGWALFETVHQRKDGTRFPVEVAVSHIRSGGESYSLTFVRDISERKRAEEQLNRANEALEERVRERTRELERANAAKSEFLSRMSHELRTPLNAILGFGQLLELGVSDERQRRQVREIRQAGDHLLALINDVLDLARVESGKLSISPEPVDLHAAVLEAVSLLRPLARERSLQWPEPSTQTLQACQVQVRADRTRLKQVLLNLLSNAIKYNRPQGMVGISCHPETREGQPWVRLAVRDTGEGLTPEQQARLFVPFERLDAEARRIEGTGIGLALSKRLIEMMGGSIGVDSQPGAGSEFWFRLPVASATVSPSDAPDRQAAAATEAPVGSVIDVLCIEDNPTNLRLVEAVFAGRPDVRLLTAMAPGLGLELARSHRPAVILLDINLPDMDGYEVMRCLREHPATAAIPVVAVSANAMPQDLERGKAAGFAAYLTKPLDLARLLAVVDQIVRNAGRASSS